MKNILSLIAALLLSACVSLPPSIESIRTNPGGKVSIESTLQSEALYKALTDQARSCFNSHYWLVNSDFYPDKTATVSLRMHSLTINGVIWAADLTPSNRGTSVMLYYKSPEPDGFSKPIKEWIENGPPMLCPGETKS